MRYVDDARRRILMAAKDMLQRGLVEGTAGNISARQRDGTLVITPAAALHITALVERCARITWGARALGPLHPLPDDVNDRFAGYYAALREKPL